MSVPLSFPAFYKKIKRPDKSTLKPWVDLSGLIENLSGERFSEPFSIVLLQ
ncbi:hypothetical protein IV70_GL001516 [Carnobacterium maltaromaticum DSM 20342]|nr:hypothetical protein IV70_GL001516 [Carnobacterium maltaromaticum DSM 20342]KRN70984.1 hypothetical protein IV76_GL001199 [Carnobacterium maltaromaticum]